MQGCLSSRWIDISLALPLTDYSLALGDFVMSFSDGRKKASLWAPCHIGTNPTEDSALITQSPLSTVTSVRRLQHSTF